MRLFKKRPQKKTILYSLLITLLVLWSLLSLAPRLDNHEGRNPFIKDGDKPMLIAHGGGNHEFPDNTLEAFYNAYHADPDAMMETDVSMTKDEVIILSHDTTLDRKTDLTNAPIEDVNYEDLMDDEVDFGYENLVDEDGVNTSEVFTRYRNYQDETVTPMDVPYPPGVEARHESVFLATTLEELIKAFPDNYINVEIKQKGETGTQALEKTLELLEALDEEYDTFERVVLASFHESVYDAIQDYHENENPELMFSPQERSIRKFVILEKTRLDLFYRDPVTVFQLPTDQQGILFAKRSILHAAHEHNIAVHFWTINDSRTMERLIDLGADGIMTDRPHLLAEILKQP
ncbi:MAG: glycerophosphodiester phosphodiesterase family protein [Bacillota bacterium]